MGLHSFHSHFARAQRRASLQATVCSGRETLVFAQQLRRHRRKAYLLPNEGVRGLTSVALRQAQIESCTVVTSSFLEGQTDYRERLHIPESEASLYPSKTIFCWDMRKLRHRPKPDVYRRSSWRLGRMGEYGGDTLGVSRPYVHAGSSSLPVCWLMADG